MGAFYTSSELAQWRDRAINGPFKTAGDAFPNSPGDWDRMKSEANTFLNSDNRNGMIWAGLTVPHNTYNSGGGVPLGQVNSPIFGTSYARIYVRLMSAAFIDLVEGTTIYRQAIKNYLLAQAVVPGVDFSDRYLYPTTTWPSGNNDVIWTVAVWMLKLLRAYDWVGRENFTVGEQSTLETWFEDCAYYMSYHADVRSIGPLYQERGVPLEDYVFLVNTKSTPYYRTASQNGPEKYRPGTMYNNRRWGQVNYYAHVGVLLNNSTYTDRAKWSVKEFIAFHIDKDGYPYELDRSIPSQPWRGMGYIMNSTQTPIVIAKILYINGYENLYDFTTGVYVNLSGQKTVDPVKFKSLRWLVEKQFVDNLMKSNSLNIYPYGTTGTSTDILMHYCNATEGSDQRRHRNKVSEPAGMANQYYNSDKIRSMYMPPGTEGLCGFVSNSTSQGAFLTYHGSDGQYPSFMFAYCDVFLEDGIAPPLPPLPPPISTEDWIDDTMINQMGMFK